MSLADEPNNNECSPPIGETGAAVTGFARFTLSSTKQRKVLFQENSIWPEFDGRNTIPTAKDRLRRPDPLNLRKIMVRLPVESNDD